MLAFPGQVWLWQHRHLRLRCGWEGPWVEMDAWIMPLTPSCELFPTMHQQYGQGSAGEGDLRHCLTESQGQRLSRRPGTTRSSSLNHHRTNNAALQLRLWPHSHPLQIPPPSHLFNRALPASPTPQHGPGHRERWHAFLSQHPVQTRWLSSATASNKSEHIYDAKHSGTLPFAALSYVRGLTEAGWVDILLKEQIFSLLSLYHHCTVNRKHN